jgi:thiosulfate/3-mercaptopyruvate sulfurtransferase
MVLMRVLTMLALVGALLTTGNAEKSKFCPECWAYRNDPDVCGACRKPLVELMTVPRSWFWCAAHALWHAAPCADHERERCCVERRSAAFVGPVGPEPTTLSLYCPQCRSFAEAGPRCPECRKRLVWAEAVERVWYWCAGDEAWYDETCSMHATGKCCSPRQGRLLLVPASWREASSRQEDGRRLLVSPGWLALSLDDPAVVVVHVGFPADAADAAERPDYLDGHIPGARRLFWSEIAVTRNGTPNEFPPLEKLVAMVRRLGLDERHQIVLYDTGAGLEAARAFVGLEKVGLGRNVALLDGQWKRWRKDGGPVSRLPAEYAPSSYLPRRLTDVTVTLEATRDLVWLAGEPGASVAILDARPAEEFVGLKAGKGVERAGHLPGAASLPWFHAILGRENPVWRPEDELRELFESAGARPGDLVVTVCRTGVQASHLYFTARLLGYDARLYDGSFIEWSADAGLPVETFVPEK